MNKKWVNCFCENPIKTGIYNLIICKKGLVGYYYELCNVKCYWSGLEWDLSEELKPIKWQIIKNNRYRRV